jgi:hypothetical protein
MRAKWLAVLAVVALSACGGSGSQHSTPRDHDSSNSHGGSCRFSSDSVAAQVSPLVELQPPGSSQREVTSMVRMACDSTVTVGSNGAAKLTFGANIICQVERAAPTGGEATLVTRDPLNVLFRLGAGHTACTFGTRPDPVPLCGLGEMYPNGQTQATATCSDPVFQVEVRAGFVRVVYPGGGSTNLSAGQGFNYDFYAGAPNPGPAEFSADDLAAFAAQADELHMKVPLLPQVIMFTSSAPTHAVPPNSYVVTATGGGSGNQVMFSIDPTSASVCTISNGDVVTFQTPGTCLIDAQQAGNTAYAQATGQQPVTVYQQVPA